MKSSTSVRAVGLREAIGCVLLASLLMIPTAGESQARKPDRQTASVIEQDRSADVPVFGLIGARMVVASLDTVCRLCSEAEMPPPPEGPGGWAHYWHQWPCAASENQPEADDPTSEILPVIFTGTKEQNGTARAGDPEDGCRACDTEEDHCDSPEIPHAGKCPAANCAGGGGSSQLALAMLEARDSRGLVRQMTEHPDAYGFDRVRSAYQVYTCTGGVLLHVVVDDELESAIFADLVTRARHAYASRGQPHFD